VGGLATGARANCVALNRVLTVESKLVGTDYESILVLLHVVKDDLAALRNVSEVPLEDQLIARDLIGRADKDVLSCGIRNFFFLGHGQSDLLLRALAELLLNFNGAALNNVRVLAHHVQRQVKLAASRAEVLVRDDKLWVQGQWAHIEWADSFISHHLVENGAASPAIHLVVHGIEDLKVNPVVSALIKLDRVVESFEST
jgi:hypothetical protein